MEKRPEAQFRLTVPFYSALKSLISSQLRRNKSQKRKKSKKQIRRLIRANSKSPSLRKETDTSSRRAIKSMPTVEALLLMVRNLTLAMIVASLYHSLWVVVKSLSVGMKVLSVFPKVLKQYSFKSFKIFKRFFEKWLKWEL